MERWSGLPLTAVVATGDLTQLYPTWFPAGVLKATATPGQQIRKPTSGVLKGINVQTDGINGGIIEIWDVSGEDIGANVSTATAITNAQLVALQAEGRAKLIFSKDFTANVGPFDTTRVNFMHGLAARYVNAAGTCKLNLGVEGGAYLTSTAGA